jgi:hypothetical protein
VYSEPHPLVDEEKGWLENYEAAYTSREGAE